MERHVFAIGSTSVASWLPEFRGTHGTATVLAVPRHQADLSRLAGEADEVIFVSDHATLARDAAWAEELREQSHRVSCQSPEAVAAGLDKVTMKQRFVEFGVPTLPWRTADEVSPGWPADVEPAVVKQRSATQSEGIRMGTAHEAPLVGEYCEPFREGTEFSVNVFRRAAEVTVLPPVWKGRTSRALVPPARRPRACAPGVVDAEIGLELERIARDIAVALRSEGFLEVEYLVDETGSVTVLEINPRVSGTLRISALAASEPVFAWYSRPAGQHTSPAVAYAVEVPNPGPRLVMPDLGLYATSRLTVAARDRVELVARIGHLRTAGLVNHTTTALLEAAVDVLPAMMGEPWRARAQREPVVV